MKVLLIFYFLILFVAARKDDFEDLEFMLQNIDNIGDEQGFDSVFNVEDSQEVHQEDKSPQEDKPEPEVKNILITEELSPPLSDDDNGCEEKICGWGKECFLDENNKPGCRCATNCQDLDELEEEDKVCSSQNETFTSLCHLYQERCRCKKGQPECESYKHSSAHLEHLGRCKELEPCTLEHLEQFPDRMAEWLFQVMRDMKKKAVLENDRWNVLLEEAESDDQMKHVYPVIWKFCDLDTKPSDKYVTHHELIPLTAPVIPLESCIKPFLKKCDMNYDSKITLEEWGECLGIEEDKITEHC